MANLKDQARELYKQGMSLAQIAASLGVSPGTVRSWKSRYKWGDVAAPGATQRATQQGDDLIAQQLAEKLTEKEKLFAQIYLKNFNATQAAIKAGYTEKYPSEMGYQLLRKPTVRAYINHLKEMKRAALLASAEDVLERYMKIAFADITDFVDFGTKIEPITYEHPVTGDVLILPNKVNTLHFKNSSEVDGGIICEISTSKSGAKIKLEDRQKALEWLARYFEMNPMDRHKQEYDRLKLQLERERLEHTKDIDGKKYF